MVAIEMLDKQGNRSLAHPEAAPTIRVNVNIGNVLMLQNGSGLIDTGASSSMINAKHTQFCSPDFTATNATTTGPQNIVGYSNSQIEIIGIPGSFHVSLLQLGFTVERADVLIGRDILQHCRMVYDPPRDIYTLERINHP